MLLSGHDRDTVSSTDAMPVCIKSEPRKASASQQQPQLPPPPSSQPPPSNGSTPTPTAQTGPTTAMSHTDEPGAQVSQQPVTTTPASSSTPAVQSTNGAVEAEKEKPPAPEDAIDYDSVRGVFGWATLDEVNVPYIFRKGKRFVAVRIVEKKVLNKYPNSFPDELGRKEPLVSYFVTEAEATLLNEINTVHCSFEYGHQPFTTKDLIVDLVEFEDFYKLVKKTFPENVLAAMTAGETRRSSVEERKGVLSKVCGWMQINNTVTPYILRATEKYVPLSVIQYAAQLLTKEQVEGHLPTPEECELLNETCRAAGFDFTFGRNTKLLHITEIRQRCQVKIFDLPFENPLQHAQYIDSLSQGEVAGGQPSPLLGPPGMGGMSLPYQSRPVLSEGPPNLNPFTPYNPFMSMMNMISQAPATAPNHLHSRTPPQPPSKSMAARPQMSLVRTQTAPIFYPPGTPASQSRGSQINNTSAPGLVQAGQNKTPGLPAGGPIQRLGSASPQGRMGGPVGSSHPMQAHGGVNIPGAEQLPHVSSPSGLPRLPPPNYLGASQMRQPLTHPSLSSSPAHRGAAPPHSFMASPRLPAEAMSGVGGPVPRGAVPGGGFPPGVMPSAGGMPSHMGVPPHQPSAQSQPPPSHSQPHLASQYHPSGQLPSRAGAPTVPSQLNQSGVPGHANPGLPSPNPASFPGQMTAVAPQSHGASGRVPGLDPASKMGVGSGQTYAADNHLKLVMDIKAEMVNGKSISCMNRNSVERTGSFCLVEAVAKLYFPKCSLSEFVNALQNVLGINLPVCTEQEAKAFIHFYNLPVAKLNDNHMISLPDLKNYFPQISYMFRHAAMDTASMSGLFLTSGSQRSAGSEGSTKLASPSAPISIVLNNNDSSEVIDLDSGPPTPSTNSPIARSAMNLMKRKIAEGGGVLGGKQGRFANDQRIPYRVDEVDGQVTAAKANVSQRSATSQVIVID